jgi:cysteine-rich repeat protein
MAVPTVCTQICGDGRHVGNFVNNIDICDEGNGPTGNTGCFQDCTGVFDGWNCTGYPVAHMICVEVCADGFWTVSESCDDRNLVSGDGCSSACVEEPGWIFVHTIDPNDA